MNDRMRGVVVYPLLDSAYEGQHTTDRYVLGINRTTTEVWLIHDPEGVCYPVNHKKPWRFNDYNLESRFFTLLEVLNMADYSKPLDLADVVRTFGSRLEVNFRVAYSALTNDKPQQSDYNASVVDLLWTMQSDGNGNVSWRNAL